jgi:hypothetical protein
MNLKTTASQSPLKNEPKNVLPENHQKPQMQASGDKAPLQTTPSNVKYGANTPNGKLQLIGDKISMGQSPVLGYQSANTPMSDRAVDSKKGY